MVSDSKPFIYYEHDMLRPLQGYRVHITIHYIINNAE